MRGSLLKRKQQKRAPFTFAPKVMTASKRLT